jgi:hypothetical protein
MTDEKMLEAVRHIARASEVYRVHRFQVYRDRPNGDTRQVLVEVLDRGLGNWKRWLIEAQDGEGRRATGNPENSLSQALLGVHWHDLDKDDID